jgi:hypothetical protein
MSESFDDVLARLNEAAAITQESLRVWHEDLIRYLASLSDTSKLVELEARISALEALQPKPQTNLEAIAGLWVLEEVRNQAELNENWVTIEAALSDPAVRGFSLRLGWDSIDVEWATLDRARELTSKANKDLMVRFMAGRRTPERFRGRSYTDSSGYIIPVPYNTDGSPNLVFEDAYREVVTRLAAWCRTSGVRCLHCAWYGRYWAEYDHNYVVKAAPEGYSLGAWQEAHRRLLAICMNVAGPDLAVELPGSGHQGSPAPGMGSILAAAADRFGDRNDKVYHQANGWPIYTGRSTPRLHLGLQPFAVTMGGNRNEHRRLGRSGPAPDWPSAFEAATKIEALYCEVYTPAFSEPEDSLALKSNASSYLNNTKRLVSVTT